ncbi:pyrroline-5-carboxylate reductase [Eggerthellaceae bacterium zg-893]|nr:pyrroline-5-carboxylate reductase [Eggerthellaceae bacterium zg-893]
MGTDAGHTHTVASAAVIGAGTMGCAILSGMLAATEGPFAAVGPADVVAADPGQAHRDAVAERFGVRCVACAADIDRAVDVVFLCVKPQVMDEALRQVNENPLLVGEHMPLFVTVAAGLKTPTYEAALPTGARVVRAMPNTPLSVGAGATGLCAGACATADDVAVACGLFSAVGCAVVVEEDAMDAVCAVSGSGPAYVDAFIEALRDAGAFLGLRAEVAETLALQTVLGAAKLLQETGQAPEEARRAVCSPGGTTLAGLDALFRTGFQASVQAAVAAADQRSKELSA